MPKFDVEVCATLENVHCFYLEDSDDWYFRTQCTKCKEESPDPIYFNLVQKMAVEGSRGEANYIAKCKFCDQRGYIEYCKNTLKEYTDNSENFQKVATFECRNIEIAKFLGSANFKARGLGEIGD